MCLVCNLNIAKNFSLLKTSCVIIHYPITIYLSALFFHGPHVMVGIVNSLSLYGGVRTTQQPGGPRAGMLNRVKDGGLYGYCRTSLIQSTYLWVTDQDKFLTFKSNWKEKKLLLKTWVNHKNHTQTKYIQ